MKKTISPLFTITILILVFSFLLICAPHFACASTYSYDNPLNVNSFTEWFSNLLLEIQGVVAWLAIIAIVIGGIIYITSGGSVRQTTLGKSIIIFALVGFAIAVAAPSLLREIRDIRNNVAGGGGGSTIFSTAPTVATIVERIMSFLITLIGMLSVIGFVTGGILFISAGGDTTKATKGRQAVLYSILAFAVSGAALIILNQIIQLLEA